MYDVFFIVHCSLFLAFVIQFAKQIIVSLYVLVCIVFNRHSVLMRKCCVRKQRQNIYITWACVYMLQSTNTSIIVADDEHRNVRNILYRSNENCLG